MARRKQVDPVIELVDAEPAEGTDEVDTDFRDAGTGKFVTEEYADENPGTTVEERNDVPESSPEEQDQAFKQFVLETLNAFDERIRDIEIVAGQQFLQKVQESHGLPEVFGMLQERGENQDIAAVNDAVYDPEDDDDAEDYVSGVQRSFDRGEGDGDSWYRP